MNSKFVIKVKFFNHEKKDWEYLQEDGADALFLSHPDAQEAIMRRQLRAYNENEFELETYIVCECGTLLQLLDDVIICDNCGSVYNRLGKRLGTSFPLRK